VAFSSLFLSRCLWYWMLKSSSSVRSIYHTSINQFGYLCGASYPSSQHLLPLISFEALQSSAVFCHSRHVSNFTQLCWISSNPYLYLPDELSHHIPISKNLFNHAMIYQWQKVIGIVPAAITPNLFFQPRLCQAAKRDLGFKSRWICMSSSQSN
jgi:hypothetical protein